MLREGKEVIELELESVKDIVYDGTIRLKTQEEKLNETKQRIESS